ncbi:hypothetical protein A2303_06520 [Candidatus Falkowbacteria bacterium RIFOXYB2_FULL_47_14]|uniref:Cohesin domain-containing protein n=1 Tax=Candidatus Falkowbacteria bacterium RIFOXYA2_FULL_47_19 TaxID=1797994 RepID=A0A1F5SE29_9BACT|nr:MAG: hypothetical protein A2227_04585 [Candidatus Falkowbacteria bacterium RIFOXYA2_FULL_47_19]OGF35677.1 MAG: hypothetical protein A2468_04485 [Candidatus Falkowbacteria bacterium RIFOXYC2_FULL_46_15]OGF43193.1 MAG: hypothetical protein A2303_06520 [Candidatus Falkowbacteria bacterium RIFOXYB2_FULL_47_14]
MDMKKLFFKLFLFCFIISGLMPFFNAPAEAAGATLFLSPAAGTYAVGKSFTVNVMVNSGGGVGVNAAEGTIKYDPAYLSIGSLSKTGTIFSLWTAEPVFSNTEGKISFGGGSPSAYKGAAGSIFSINFTAKKAGETAVNFTSGIVLAADGKGTNVFSGFGQAKYVLEDKAGGEETPKPKPKDEPKKDEPKGILPPTPEISSPTHPETDIWYTDNRPEFEWKILSDLTNVSYLINDNPTADPGVTPEGIVETKKFDPVKDGTWYFHLKYQNRYGWGNPAHRKFMVDSTPPESFRVTVDNESDSTNPTPKIIFKTTDKTSGLDYYGLQIGTQSIRLSVAEMEQGFYRPSALAPGEYHMDVAAFDKAGNAASSSATFTVDSLKAPIITDLPKIMDRREDLIVRGTSFYPRVTVKLFIGQSDKDIKEFSTQTDDQGNWSYFHAEKLARGNYKVWAKIIDGRGAQSLDSTVNILTVISPAIMEAYGWWILFLLLAIIMILTFYILYQRNKFRTEKMRIKSETEEMKQKLSKIFAALREEVDELIELADKKPGLSESEQRIKEKLEESLDISEEFIGKEVDDIEKEIKLDEKDGVK